ILSVSTPAAVESAQTSAPNLVSFALHGFVPSVAFQFEELSRITSTLGLVVVPVPPAKMSMSSACAAPMASAPSAAAIVRCRKPLHPEKCVVCLMATPSIAGRKGLGHGNAHRHALPHERRCAGHVVLGRGGDFPDGVRAGCGGGHLADERAAEASAVGGIADIEGRGIGGPRLKARGRR